MTGDNNKTEIIQFRLTVDQLELLDKAFKHYMSTHNDVITRAEYIRTMLMIACLREVGLLTQSQRLKVVEDCACVEVHTCGAQAPSGRKE